MRSAGKLNLRLRKQSDITILGFFNFIVAWLWKTISKYFFLKKRIISKREKRRKTIRWEIEKD